MRLPRPHLSLTARLLVLGIAQLVVLTLSALAIAFATRPRSPDADMVSIGHDTLEELDAHRDDGLDAWLASVATTRHVELTLYTARGDVVASSTNPPLVRPERRSQRIDQRALGDVVRGDPPELPPGGAPDEGPPEFRPDGPFSGPAPARTFGPLSGPLFGPFFGPFFGPRRGRHGVEVSTLAGDILVVDHEAPLPLVVLPILFLLVGLLLVGTSAWVFGRWIVRPLEQLADTAGRVGAGDLAARTSLDRTDEIGKVARTFDAMAERIQAMVRAEREMLANVSHELRTPLARIRVAMDLANEGDAALVKEALGDIGTDLAEIEAIVEDILTAMRFEMAAATGDTALGKDVRAGLPLGERRPVSPTEVAELARDRFRARHPARPLEVSIEDDLPPVEIDPAIFRRVMDNLLSNAHKYTLDKSAPIELSVRRSGDRVAFDVTDRGIGIAPDDMERVFEPFFRGERSRTRAAGGVGLGLTLSKKIVEAHQGDIRVVASRLSKGTCMRVTLPVRHISTSEGQTHA